MLKVNLLIYVKTPNCFFNPKFTDLDLSYDFITVILTLKLVYRFSVNIC